VREKEQKEGQVIPRVVRNKVFCGRPLKKGEEREALYRAP